MPTLDLPLRDVHQPEAIAWWPPAIGWWVLVVLLPLVMLFIWWLYRRLTRKTAVKTARKQLTAIKQNDAMDDLRKLSEISILLRRVAISQAPRSETAALTGEAWLAYLDGSVPGAPFTQGIGRCLSDGGYRKQAPPGLNVNQLIDLCEMWLRAQRK